MYARIDLSKTNYTHNEIDWRILSNPNPDELNEIYTAYCRYKAFKSVMPIFDSEYFDSRCDVIGYYEDKQMVAFSLIRKFDHDNIEAVQFAWNYQNPKLQLGIKSLKNECAIYKKLGYKYLYLGHADSYKSKIDGFEILGPL